MEMKNIPFGTTNWADIVPTEHKGETGMALWRTQQFDTVRVRMGMDVSVFFLGEVNASGRIKTREKR